jgi:hypothetical protein
MGASMPGQKCLMVLFMAAMLPTGQLFRLDQIKQTVIKLCRKNGMLYGVG